MTAPEPEGGTPAGPGGEAYFRALAWQRALLDRWAWSQAIAPQPLPVCLVTGI